MRKCEFSKLEVAVFPWVAYGHFIPFLHLSNKLAQKGHKISYLLPKGVESKLENMNQFPNLIQFFPLLLPQVDGLSPGAETTSVVPMNQQKYLAFSVDQTRDQVESIFKVVKPDVGFYDIWFWIPDLARKLGIIPIFYAVGCSMGMGMAFSPKEITKEMTVEEVIEWPAGYPCSTVRFKAEEVPLLLFVTEDFGSGLSCGERMRVSLVESDALAFRTYRELEGPFLDYIAQESGKPILLSGPCLPETETQQLDEKWVSWLSQFEPGSVVFCALGSQTLKPPIGCSTVEEALPEGFEERIKGRGLVYGDWVPQQLLLHHPNIGCFVNHCGYGSMWEFLLSDCQIVLIPEIPDQILNTRWMANELKIGVEVERDKNRRILKESLSEDIKLVMDKDNETAKILRANHAKLKQALCSSHLREEYINNFIQALHHLVQK
ncbi:putative UDP-Glycosyltransferase superfamily protein [Hibiscus syriacus]|uniref:UDP-Glycosyltransferase superfamily protein n=1 Tax=Hibiscus syriacus TaxID=106335 RepID=A0A6A2YKD5_HIBSY|nr:putative UDP-Glycosyltransferase superfamily protein [Hibiscus syriacus]